MFQVKLRSLAILDFGCVQNGHDGDGGRGRFFLLDLATVMVNPPRNLGDLDWQMLTHRRFGVRVNFGPKGTRWVTRENRDTRKTNVSSGLGA